MTDYDPPRIVNPENVDALTHRQILDAFAQVGDGVGPIVANWDRARNDWCNSTEALVRAIRTAVDGHWTGAAADAAANAVLDYCAHAEGLADLFEGTAKVVTNTAAAAAETKAFLPPEVPVTADQKKDPTGFDSQTREAARAQDEARQIMQQRYVIPFRTQDTLIPTFPPAMSPIVDPVAPQVPGGTTTPGGGNVADSGGSDTRSGDTTDQRPQPDTPGTDHHGDPTAGDSTKNDSGQSDSKQDDSARTDSTRTDSTQPASTSSSSTASSPTDPTTSHAPASTTPAGTDDGKPSTPATPEPATVPATAPPAAGGPSYLETTPAPPERLGVPSHLAPPPASVPADPPAPQNGRPGEIPTGGPARNPAPTVGPAPAPAPKPPVSVPATFAPAATAAAAAGAATGSAAHPHNTAPPPRVRRARRTDDEEKQDKKVDLRHESHTTELLGKSRYVPPTIGE